jgi:hypothetical protein
MGKRYRRLGCSYRIAPLGKTKRGSFVFSAFGFDTWEKPLASGGAALPNGKMLFGEAIRRKSEPQRRRSQEEMKKCVATYMRIGVGSKLADTEVRRLHAI